MNERYRRLCGQERNVIHNLKQAGKTQKEIAQAISRSQGTISKELSRNRGQRGNWPAQAQRLASERKAGKKTRPNGMVGMLKAEVEAPLCIKHSPDQISKALNKRSLALQQNLWAIFGSGRSPCPSGCGSRRRFPPNSGVWPMKRGNGGRHRNTHACLAPTELPRP